MLDLEQKYLALAHVTVRKIYRQTITLRCPVCGDSKKNKFKARGNLSETPTGAVYFCHNCDFSGTFSQLLGALDTTLKDAYIREVNKDRREKFIDRKDDLKAFNKQEIILPELSPSFVHMEDKEYKVSELTDEAISYLKKRCISEEDFKHFKFVPELSSLVVFLKQEKIFGYQLRSIKEKFFHNYVQDGYDKCWNLDYVLTLPARTTIYVFESIFNALSVTSKNVLAGLGSSLSAVLLSLLSKYNLVFCYDNDITGVKKTIQFTQKGYSAVVHHSKFEWCDFNDARQAGVTKEQLQAYLEGSVMSAKIANMKLRLKK